MIKTMSKGLFLRRTTPHDPVLHRVQRADPFHRLHPLPLHDQPDGRVQPRPGRLQGRAYDDHRCLE